MTVPPAVWREVVEQDGKRPGSKEVRSAREAGWIVVKEPGNEDLVHLLRQSLGAGESEALALAVQRRETLLLVDERDARRTADAYDLPKTGTVGLLTRATVDGEVDELAPLLPALREDAGFWIGDELVAQALREVGEDPATE